MDKTDTNIIDDSALDAVNGGAGVWDGGSKGDQDILVKCDNPYCKITKRMRLSELSSAKLSKCTCGGRFNRV